LVQQQLFGARPTFSGVLREVQAAVAELDGVHLAWANPNHMYSLQVSGLQYSGLQDQQQKKQQQLRQELHSAGKLAAAWYPTSQA
jgi:hypothetical protein